MNFLSLSFLLSAMLSTICFILYFTFEPDVSGFWFCFILFALMYSMWMNLYFSLISNEI